MKFKVAQPRSALELFFMPFWRNFKAVWGDFWRSDYPGKPQTRTIPIYRVLQYPRARHAGHHATFMQHCNVAQYITKSCAVCQLSETTTILHVPLCSASFLLLADIHWHLFEIVHEDVCLFFSVTHHESDFREMQMLEGCGR